MIKVRITNNGIRMDGHAGHRINGQDIVCSAVSALTCTLIMGLQELTDNRIRADLCTLFSHILLAIYPLKSD